MKKTLIFLIFLCSGSVNADNYILIPKNNNPYDYSINSQSPSQSAADGFNNGVKMAKMLEQGRQQREINQARAEKNKREIEYRTELKKFYDKPETLNDENLMKLMILYPEYQDTTEKIQNSYHKLGSNK
ncbi:hypothetical protein [uncultured Acinetobacter sp.]|uniref:hypothetical protein n=1 Tax=uncultured Acinetobacter sp. TaxID=165433 RepID=UPI0037482360